VRVVNVHIVKSSEGEVLSTFAQCLQSLPNVHTLQIAGVYGQAVTAIKTAFKSQRFSQIHTVILPSFAHHRDILSSCPQVKDVTFIDLIVKAMLKLCRITIHCWHFFTADRIRLLAALPHLHTIIIRQERQSLTHISQADVGPQPFIQEATDVLKKHEGDENGSGFGTGREGGGYSLDEGYRS